MRKRPPRHAVFDGGQWRGIKNQSLLALRTHTERSGRVGISTFEAAALAADLTGSCIDDGGFSLEESTRRRARTLCGGDRGWNPVGCLRTNASSWLLLVRAVQVERTRAGTHLELESKLRACLALGTLSPVCPNPGLPREGFAVRGRPVGEGRAPWGVVLAVLFPEMAGGQPLFF